MSSYTIPRSRFDTQGKSCFNFKAMELALFKELTELTKKSVERCKKER